MAGAWTNISDAVFEHARNRPSDVAVIEGPHSLTFAEFAELIAKATVYLQKQKIKSGDRVGVRMNNSADHLILSLALLRIGAVKFELSPNHTPKELEEITLKFSLSALFVEPPTKVYRGARTIVVDLAWRAIVQGYNGDVRHDDKKGEPFFANLSSGSTGVSKGVVVRQRDIIARYREAVVGYSSTGIISNTDPATVLMAGSLSFSGFHSFLLYQIMSGARIVIIPDLSRFYDIVRQFSYYENAVAIVTPNICSVFLACAQKVMLLPNLRALVSTGQPLDPASKKAMVTRVTPNYHEIYGTSSTGWTSILHPQDMARRSQSVGRPVPGMDVEIVDTEGKPLPANKVGRLRCRSATTSDSFIVPEKPGEEGYRDGWFYTGDLGMFDSGRYLHIKGRVSGIIVRNGVEVYPAEVEAALQSHPNVVEAAVIGLRSQRRGQEVFALVETNAEIPHDELVRHCADKLPEEKRPSAIAYTQQLPRTPNGKIAYEKVRELAIQIIRKASADKRA